MSVCLSIPNVHLTLPLDLKEYVDVCIHSHYQCVSFYIFILKAPLVVMYVDLYVFNLIL